MKKKLIIAAAILLAIFIILASIFLAWYNEDVYKELKRPLLGAKTEIVISYNNQEYSTDNREIVYFGYFENEFDIYCASKVFFGEVDKNTKCITMDIKDYGTLQIYNKDKNSVYFELQRIGKKTRNYILTGKAIKTDNLFNDFVDALYKDTLNDMFKQQ